MWWTVRSGYPGRIVAEELRNTEKMRPNVALDRWIVMPDHLHVIIVIHNETDTANPVETPRRGVSYPRLSRTKAS